MSTHAHAADQPAGSKHDNKLRPDVTGNVSSDIGQHFPPMVHNAPIHGLASISRSVVQCPSCSNWIHHDGSEGSFKARRCGTTLDYGMVGVPVPCSCHN